MVSPAPKTKSISMDAWKNSSPSILADARNRGRKSTVRRLSYDETRGQPDLLLRQKSSPHTQSWLSFKIFRTDAHHRRRHLISARGTWEVTSPCARHSRPWRDVPGSLGGFWSPKLSRHDHPRSLPLFGTQQRHFCGPSQAVSNTAGRSPRIRCFEP